LIRYQPLRKRIGARTHTMTGIIDRVAERHDQKREAMCGKDDEKEQMETRSETGWERLGHITSHSVAAAFI
jgi:hypothetical protein